jgi:hypothetical protein
MSQDPHLRRILHGLFDDELLNTLSDLYGSPYLEACKRLKPLSGVNHILFKSLLPQPTDHNYAHPALKDLPLDSLLTQPPDHDYDHSAKMWYKIGQYVEIHIAIGRNYSRTDVKQDEHTGGRYSVLKFGNMYDVFKFLLSANHTQLKLELVKSTRVWTGDNNCLQWLTHLVSEGRDIEADVIYHKGKCTPKLSQLEQVAIFNDLKEDHEEDMKTLVEYNDNIFRLLARPLAGYWGNSLVRNDTFGVLDRKLQ